MIVCSCNVLTLTRILEAAERLARERPGRPLTPARVFRALGARAQCCTCFPLVRSTLAEAGLPITCPEPLATVADERDEMVAIG